MNEWTCLIKVDWMNEWNNENGNWSEKGSLNAEWMNNRNSFKKGWMNEWMNEWRNEWMNEWMLMETCPRKVEWMITV